MRHLIAWVLLASVLSLSGCATRINVIEQSIGAESISPASKTQHPRPVAFVSRAELKSGGIQQPLSDRFLRDVLYKLRESELFSDVTFQKPGGRPIIVNLSVDEFHDRHEGSNVPKAVLAGATLFLLAPALPIYEEYRIDVAAEVTLPEGQTKVYRAKAKIEMYCMVLETQHAIRDMYATGINRALNSLVSQIIQDSSFITHNQIEPKTLHVGSRVHYGIWTDNTKWARTDSTPPRDMGFKHLKGDAGASVVAERIQIPLETMKRVVVKNAESEMADLVVTESDRRTVNGREILFIRMQGKAEGVPLEYLVYVISGEMGTIQLYTYTGTNLISEYKQDFLEFLNGFVIEPS